MERNDHKFRLRLNLFDAIILVVVLAVGAAAVWFGLRSGGSESAPSARTVQYTVLFQSMKQGGSELIQPGDQLVDTVKNYKMGTVVSVRSEPALVQVLDQESRTYVDAELAGYEDVYLTVESTCTQGQNALLLDGGYDIRVGQTANVRTHAFIGSGRVIEISRGAEE